jgi:beta-lactamase class A
MFRSACFYILLFCFFFIAKVNAQPVSLRNKIDEIAKDTKGTVGVSILNLETHDTLTCNGYVRQPMQSVMKFPIAITVLHEIDKKKIALDQLIHLDKSDLFKTYSPLQDKYPGANVDISIRELLSYMVSLSDNVACDKLLKILGGTDKVNTYMHQLGIKKFSIKASEYEMAQAWDVQFTNWVEATELTRLLQMAFKSNFLSAKSHAYLWKIMQETSTGPNQIKGLLPVGTVVYHKTGRSGTNEQGITAATNDTGIITLPNGEHLAITILVTNSPVDLKTRELVIARIARAAYDEAVK